MSDTTPTNEDKIELVIQLIEAGMSERKACMTADIARSTFRTTALRAGVGDQYARALEGLAMDQVEKLEVAIEDMRSGTIDSQMARVEIDARKWFASKFLPKRFGDKLDLTTAGEKIENTPFKNMSTEELQALLDQSIKNNKAN